MSYSYDEEVDFQNTDWSDAFDNEEENGGYQEKDAELYEDDPESSFI